MDFMTQFLDSVGASAPGDMTTVLLALLLAFVLGNVIAWTYMLTHSGLSYSKSFVQSLVVLPMILAIVIVVLARANSILIAFGLMGAVAIVRFRNVLKDTRDTAFLLLALVTGLAVGATAYEMAIVGTAAVCLALGVLHVTSYGSRHRFDVILNFHLLGGREGLTSIDSVFHRHCRSTVLASQRIHEATGAGDFSYRLLMRDPGRSDEFVRDLSSSEGVSRISIIQRDDESEV